jgi:uncharacterized protein (DUF433 family)
MSTSVNPLLSRITVEPDKRSGKPCIRRMRITVWDVLQWRGADIADITEDEILADYPELEKEDFQAAYAYAAEFGKRASVR